MATKNYVDYTGLEHFLTLLKKKYAGNSATAFQVNYAASAGTAVRAAGDEKKFQETYLTIDNAKLDYVPNTRTIAGLDLKSNITKDALLGGINVADGAQVNVLEKVSVKDASGTSALTPDASKGVVIDLSGYAKTEDISRVLNFKGVVDYVSDLTAKTDAKVGDVYIVKYSGDSGTVKYNAEFVYASEDVDGKNGQWEEFGPTVSLDGYVTGEDFKSALASKADKSALETVYKVDGGIESGLLITKIAAEKDRIDAIVGTPDASKTIQDEIDATEARLDTIEGTGEGSIAKALADAKAFTTSSIEALDVVESTGDYVKTIKQVDGKIVATPGNLGDVSDANTSAPVSGAKVVEYVDLQVATKVNDLNADEVGGAGKFVQSVSQANGKVSATAIAIATDLTATSLDNNAPVGALAAKNYADSCKVMTAETGGEQITVMAPLDNTEIDKMFSTATV